MPSDFSAEMRRLLLIIAESAACIEACIEVLADVLSEVPSEVLTEVLTEADFVGILSIFRL